MLDINEIVCQGSDIAAGDRFLFSKTIESCDVYLFAGISGDYNPAHIDEENSKTGMFKQRVAHGMVCAGLISGAVTQKINAAAVISKQTIRFNKPVFFGDTVTIRLTVLEVNQQEVVLETIAVNQREEIVAEGKITVKMPAVK